MDYEALGFAESIFDAPGRPPLSSVWVCCVSLLCFVIFSNIFKKHKQNIIINISQKTFPYPNRSIRTYPMPTRHFHAFQISMSCSCFDDFWFVGKCYWLWMRSVHLERLLTAIFSYNMNKFGQVFCQNWRRLLCSQHLYCPSSTQKCLFYVICIAIYIYIPYRYC